ncbi:hypothetical protein B0T11DRAFT_321207 [Plectosphaerella cucumerina]|uniref:Zn(2)-C6 fungal-type domain-containing protein n=1 Tax=Plectosphaerella cucumerina TaxID=40658 RepID=A0A8K0TDP6_9PEZI|nr:hypothetical protein B0T11DRAFT_321207 [Plectosphaerella cucumerina]
MYNDLTRFTNDRKRPSAPAGADLTKKRAPYASRACGACRRRKGRCSGDHPCSYCVSRSLQCDGGGLVYGESSDVGEASQGGRPATPAPTSTSRDERELPATRPRGETEDSSENSEARMLASLGAVVADLQEQVGTLASRMNYVEKNGSPCHADTSISNSNSSGNFNTMSTTGESGSSLLLSGTQSKRPTQRRRFCGPTSPDYSLNIAQIRLQQGDANGRPARPRVPSIDDNQSDDDEGSDDLDEDDNPGLVRVSVRTLEMLTGFRRLLSKHESLRLVYTYQEVYGGFHPMLDLEVLTKQVEDWYDQTPGASSYPPPGNFPVRVPTDESSLLTINLIFAIALCAESTSDVDMAKVIYAYCREAINRKMLSPAPKIENAAIALLVGTYHFFRNDARFAWRMCGIAGNMLLELGLHSHEVPDHILSSDQERTRVIAIICTTIVLDRQWSAATGLPTHFRESHFHHAMKSSVESPYLKAMVAFIAVSDKFTSPIARITATSQPYEEDDNFTILNFQIEQWRKNAIGSYDLAQHGTWRTTPIGRIPSWAILLNLRANAAHSMLLRPFFFANKPTAVSRKKIEPALLLVSDTISIISKLDQSTDIYRKQQPFYIHLLVSACALLSLVIAHVAQHHAALAPDLPDDFAESVSKSFRKALALATAYNQKSRASPWHSPSRRSCLHINSG